MSVPNLHVALALALGLQPDRTDDQLITEVEKLRADRDELMAHVAKWEARSDRLTKPDENGVIHGNVPLIVNALLNCSRDVRGTLTGDRRPGGPKPKSPRRPGVPRRHGEQGALL